MKGFKIAFFIYSSYPDLLSENGIPNYNGFIPINQLLTAQQTMKINNWNAYEHFLYLTQHSEILTEVESTGAITHPHIWDLLNKDHREHIDNLFMMMKDSTPGKFIND